MRSLKIVDRDLVVTNGEIEIIEGKEEEIQCVERVLSTNQGEWFLNLLHGLDFKLILGKNFDEDRARLAITEAIFQEPRVETVEKIDFLFERENRHLQVNLKLKMQGGNVIEEVVEIG